MEGLNLNLSTFPKTIESPKTADFGLKTANFGFRTKYCGFQIKNHGFQQKLVFDQKHRFSFKFM